MALIKSGCPAPGRAGLPGRTWGWAVWEMAFWLHSLIAQRFGPPRLASPRSLPTRTKQLFRTGRDIQGKWARQTAAQLLGLTPSSPASPRAAGGEGVAPRACAAVCCLLGSGFYTPPPPPTHPSDPSVCGAAALHLFPLLPPPLCFLFSTIFKIKGGPSNAPSPCRRGPDQPRFDAQVSPCFGLLLPCFWFDPSVGLES